MPVHRTAIFHATDDVASIDTALSAVKAAGFTIGQAEDRRSQGILLGERTVPRWSEMDGRQKSALDGQMWSGREGATTVMLHADAPTEAVIAFAHVLACADREREPVDMRAAGLQAALFAIAVAMFYPVMLAVLP